MATPKKKATKSPVKKAAGTKKSGDMKTKPTSLSVEAFIAKVPNETRRKDALTALALFKKITKLEPKMWGPSIIGYGSYHYKYESGREGDMCMTGFSPRSGAMVFYLMGCDPDANPFFKKLGKFKMSKGCLYINKLADVDSKILEKIIGDAFAAMRKKYPSKV